MQCVTPGCTNEAMPAKGFDEPFCQQCNGKSLAWIRKKISPPKKTRARKKKR